MRSLISVLLSFMSIIVAAFYKFVPLKNYAELKPKLLAAMQAHSIFGTVLLAEEGINGTVAGSRAAIDAWFSELQADSRLADVKHKESAAKAMPFLRQNVKLKKEIVTLGVPGVDPNRQVGEYVSAAGWNKLIEDPDVLVIDARNRYEVEIGSFANAVSPATDSFRQFPDYVQQLDPKQHKKVAMFCTGGIRCEKASAYMLQQGFEQVYHLQGGILKYLEEAPKENNHWQGECFVFDDRVTVDSQLRPGGYQQCRACRRPVNAADMASDQYQAGVSCPHCFAEKTARQKAGATERQRQFELAEQRRDRHIGAASESSLVATGRAVKK